MSEDAASYQEQETAFRRIVALRALRNATATAAREWVNYEQAGPHDGATAELLHVLSDALARADRVISALESRP